MPALCCFKLLYALFELTCLIDSPMVPKRSTQLGIYTHFSNLILVGSHDHLRREQCNDVLNYPSVSLARDIYLKVIAKWEREKISKEIRIPVKELAFSIGSIQETTVILRDLARLVCQILLKTKKLKKRQKRENGLMSMSSCECMNHRIKESLEQAKHIFG